MEVFGAVFFVACMVVMVYSAIWAASVEDSRDKGDLYLMRLYKSLPALAALAAILYAANR